MKEVLNEVAKATPPVGVSALVIYGISLSDWTLMLTSVYTLFLFGFLIRDKIYRPWLERRKQQEQ